MDKESLDRYKRRQIRDSVLYQLPLLATNVLPLITLPIFTRILSKEDYGVYALAQAYAILVGSLANFGTTISYERNYFQYRSDRRQSAQLLFSSIAFVAFNTLLLGVLTYVFRAPLSKLVTGSSAFGHLLFYAFCANCLAHLTQYYFTYYRNSEKSASFVSYTIGGNFLNFLLSIVLVAWLRIGVVGLIYSQLISSALLFAVLSGKFTAVFPLTFNKKILGESLKISYPLTPRIFLGTIDTQFDKYMIGLLNSLGGVGIYRIGQQVAMLVFSFMNQLENVFMPQVYKKMFGSKEKGGEEIGAYLTPFVYVSITLAVLISLFAEEVISLLIPKSFHGAIDIVSVLTIYSGLLFFGKIIGTQLIFTKKTHLTSLMTLVGLGLNIGLNIPFILKWGAIGAACAVLLADILSRGIFFFVAQRYYEIKWEYRKVGAIYLIFIGASLITLFLRNSAAAYSLRLAVKLISLGLFVYLGVKIRIITAENYALIKNMMKSLFLRLTGKRPLEAEKI